jgi:tetratricopeptide (TPR) repeat protein
MSSEPIYVNQKLFLGRVEEQKQFRAALHEVLAAPPGEDLPYIFLLYGDGGMGKTTLARRFRDIAQTEQPFAGEFQALWVDWEVERLRSPRLQVGREYIRPEDVFDILHQKAIQAGWGREFEAYQNAVKMRAEAEKKAAAALESSGERDEFAELRRAGASTIAKILRLGLPIGETGEKLAQAFLEAGIQVGAERAAQLRAALETRLRARLNPEQYALFLNPNEQLARALAQGFQRVAKRKPLLLFLDTYEIVDRADLWLREVMRAAGPRIVWIISGRDDLARSRPFGGEYFRGYAEEFPRRLVARDLLQLAQQDLRQIFAATAPERPLDAQAVEALSRATRGIPLAIEQAAEMWKRGVALADIVGEIDEATPRGEIVQKMTARYLLHAPEADKPLLYALALARGDIEILRAMLRPADGSPFDLEALLRRLERDYASVHAERARLYDDPAFFFREHLKAKLRRVGDERVRTFLQRAVETLRARLEQIQADLPRLEDRCESEDWTKAALDLCDYLFWLDEREAWHWLAPRLVESLAYSRELRRGLLSIASSWKAHLSADGQKRLKRLSAAQEDESPAAQADLLDELARLERLGYLQGWGEAERGAILDWRRGQLAYARGQYPEALAAYERAERALPEGCEALKQRLGEAFEDVAWEIGYRESSSGYDPLPVEAAERAYIKAISCGRETDDCFRRLGRIQIALGNLESALLNHRRAIEIAPDVAQNHTAFGDVLERLGRYDEAIAAYQRAIQLDPKDAYPHNGLGNVYSDLGNYDEAIAAYQRAIQLDPKDAAPHNGLGNVYAQLGNYDDAIAAYQRAIQLDPKDAAPHNGLGSVYQLLGQYEKALSAYQKAVELAPDGGMYRGSLVGILRKLGREAEAQAQIEIARSLMAKENEYNRACFESICGNVEQALALLKVALEKKQTSLEWARRDPDFDSIREEPGFKALVGL